MNVSLVFFLLINSISLISLIDLAWTRPSFEEHKLLSRNLQILSNLLARDDSMMIGSLNPCGIIGKPQGVCVHINLCPSDVSYEGACPDDSSPEVQCCVTVKCSHPAEKFRCMNTYKRGCHGWFLAGFCSEESPDVKCCVDKSYDPNFRYASHEPVPSDWVMGGGREEEDGGMMAAMGPPTTATTTPGSTSTTSSSKNPIKKGGSGSFDSSNFGTDGYARSNSGDGFMNNGDGNGQCECKSFEKSIIG